MYDARFLARLALASCSREESAMLWTSLQRHRDLGLLIVRIGFGGGFIWYLGGPKLTAGGE
jgi:hypothetical protein